MKEGTPVHIGKKCPAYEHMERRGSIAEGLGHAERIIGGWQYRAYPEERDRGVFPRYKRYLEEVGELDDAVVERDGSMESTRMIEDEAADVVISLIGVVVAAQGSLAAGLVRKMEQMFDKYDPCKLDQLRASGMSSEQAIHEAKALYERDRTQHTNGNP